MAGSYQNKKFSDKKWSSLTNKFVSFMWGYAEDFKERASAEELKTIRILISNIDVFLKNHFQRYGIEVNPPFILEFSQQVEDSSEESSSESGDF